MLINDKILILDFNNMATRIVFRVCAGANKIGQFIKPYDFQYELYLRKMWLNETLGAILTIMSTLMNRHVTVIAVDSENPWRMNIYEEYKQNRAKYRSATGKDMNWTSIFNLYNEFLEMLDTVPALITLKVRRCEADDIIGTLIHKNAETDNIIVSNDGDFKQLANKATLISNYHNLGDTIRYTEKEARENLITKIILGDSSDNISNMIRGVGEKTVQKLIEEHGISEIVSKLVETHHEKHPMCLHNYKRNELLIDLSKVPNVLQDEIITRYKIKKKDYSRDFEPIIEFAKKNGLNHFQHEIVAAKMRLMYG